MEWPLWPMAMDRAARWRFRVGKKNGKILTEAE